MCVFRHNMRLRFLNYPSDCIILYILMNLSYEAVECNPITNSNLSERVREFSAKEDVNTNTTKVQTLQKEKPEYYANFTPIRNPVKFKETPDSVLSSSSYSRGLVAHEHPGYAFHDYEEEPHYYGNDYHIPDANHHGFPHHNVEHYNYGHHGGHHSGHHFNHYNHALAAKTALWPLAGLALLGAAAALVTNPILLQIGVATGKRRRRDTEEVFEPDIELNRTQWDFRDSKDNDHGRKKETDLSRHRFKNNPLNKSYKTKQMKYLRDKRMTGLSVEGIHSDKPMKYEKHPDDLLIPVPLIMNNAKEIK